MFHLIFSVILLLNLNIQILKMMKYFNFKNLKISTKSGLSLPLGKIKIQGELQPFKNYTTKKDFSIFLKNKIASNLSVNKPLFNKIIDIPFLNQSQKPFITKKADHTKELEDFLQNYEKNIKEADGIASELLISLKSQNEGGIISSIEKLNKLPIRYAHLEEVKQEILNNIEKIPLTKPHSFLQFIQFTDKLEVENFEEYFAKIDNKIRKFIEDKKFNIEELALLIYAYSKYQVTDKSLWRLFYNQILSNGVENLKLESISQVLLAFTMIQSLSNNPNPNVNIPPLFSEEEYHTLYNKIFLALESKISSLSFLDTFRICISLTKRPVPLNQVSENVWKSLQLNFIKEINTFDLYQISQILLLFCETPYLNYEVFTAVEQEINEEYLEKIDEVIKQSKSQGQGNNSPPMNLTGLLEDLSKICFAFALSRQGTNYYWNNVIKTFLKLEDNVSNLAVENLLFVCYRLIDYLAHLQAMKGSEEPDEAMKGLMQLFKINEDKIVKEKLIENNKIDPFNAMMPFARFGNVNTKIWNPLVKNLMNTLKSQTQVNPFLLNDIIFALSNYYMNLILSRDQDTRQVKEEENYYMKNFNSIWTKIEDLIISLDEKTVEVPHVGNMIIDLSSVDLELNRAWAFLTELLKEKLNKFDVNNFVMVLMGFSKKDIKDDQLWKMFEEYTRNHINEFSLEDLRKIIISFLKHKEINKDFWQILENRFAKEDVLSKLTLEYFIDLQIPFAITGIYNEKIWNKFEEIIFRNLKIFESDKDYLMNTIYSFSRSGKGTPLLWNKFCNVVSKDLNGYDIDDLGHLSVCLKSEYVKKNKLDSILNEGFWNAFAKNVESKLHTAKLNSLNNLLRGIKENEQLNKNEKLVRRIENRIEELFREIPK
jgi:hypothetical protein